MQLQKKVSNGKNPSIKEIHSALTEAPALIRAKIATALDVSESIVFAIIAGKRVCSPAERESIASIYGKQVSEITWAEKEELV